MTTHQLNTYVLFSLYSEGFSGLLIDFAAGGFIYLAASEIIPEMQQERDIRKSLIQFILFIFGLVLVWSVGVVFAE